MRIRRLGLVGSLFTAACDGPTEAVPRLGREPLDDVGAVFGLVDERLEGPLGVSPASDVHRGEGIAVTGHCHGKPVVGVADVWGQREDDRQRHGSAPRAVNRGIEADPVAKRDLDAPLDLDLPTLGSGGSGDDRAGEYQ